MNRTGRHFNFRTYALVGEPAERPPTTVPKKQCPDPKLFSRLSLTDNNKREPRHMLGLEKCISVDLCHLLIGGVSL